MASPSSVISVGLGSWGSSYLVLGLGYGAFASTTVVGQRFCRDAFDGKRAELNAFNGKRSDKIGFDGKRIDRDAADQNCGDACG